jgi:hypothetical protein
MSANLRLGLSGSAVVVCPHDRPKREVTTERQVAELAPHAGFKFDPKQHRLWLCACCQNLFVDPSDEPRYCRRCQAATHHPTTAPIAPPNGRPL